MLSLGNLEGVPERNSNIPQKMSFNCLNTLVMKYGHEDYLRMKKLQIEKTRVRLLTSAWQH